MNWKNEILNLMIVGLIVFVLTGTLEAATADSADAKASAAFETIYKWVKGAATGYLGRAVALIAGVVGLISGAVTGRLMLGAAGIGIAAFGITGPTVIDAIFNSALI